MINKSYSSLTSKEAISGTSSVFQGWNLMNFLLGTLSFLIGVAALPLRLILRERIGERSIRPFSFLLAIAIHIYYFTLFDVIILIISLFGVPDDAISGMGNEGFLYLGLFILINPYTFFLGWSIRCAIKHFKQKIKDAVNGNTSYTYYRGDSRYFEGWDKPTIYGFEVNHDTIRTLVEPKVVLVVGLAISLVSALLLASLIFMFETESVLLVATLATTFSTGIVIAIDALFLAIDEISLVINRRDKVLDILDSEEDAQLIISQKDKMKSTRKRPRRDNDDLGLEDDFVQN